MGICEALGETGDFLTPFENYDEWVKFSNMYMKNPAIEKYCDHGGRYMLWLPYQVFHFKNKSLLKTNVNFLPYEVILHKNPLVTYHFSLTLSR